MVQLTIINLAVYRELMQEAFEYRFHDRLPPALKIIWANVREYEEHGTSLNRKKSNFSRRRTERSKANIRAVTTGWASKRY